MSRCGVKNDRDIGYVMQSPRNELVVHDAVQIFQLVNWVPRSAGSIRTGRLSSRGYCGRRAQRLKKQISKKKVLIFGPVRPTRQYTLELPPI